MQFKLPIPMGLAVLCTLGPVVNLLGQPLGYWYLRKYSEDYKGNAVKVLHVRTLP
jgi:hypothetical protein